MLEPKKKPCKGTGKAKGYGCGKLTPYRVYGLGKMCCYSNWLLNSENGKIKLQKAMLKATKPRRELEQLSKEDKNRKAIEKDKLQQEINKIVRLIDYGLPCLAKGYYPNQMHAGHIYSRGSERYIRYNLHNIHRQSAQSNHFQNEDGLLREELIKEYGLRYFEFIGSLRSIKQFKIEKNDYYNIYIKARKISRELEKQKTKRSLKERIILRNEINIKLNIYKEKYCVYCI